MSNTGPIAGWWGEVIYQQNPIEERPGVRAVYRIQTTLLGGDSTWPHRISLRVRKSPGRKSVNGQAMGHDDCIRRSLEQPQVGYVDKVSKGILLR
jgi:hypothetical protein